MRYSTSAALLSTLFMTSSVLAWDNTPPIADMYPGNKLGQGGNKYGIDIELIYDLTCSGCQAHHPEFLEFLDMPFLDGTYKDAVKVRYAFFPLPYHHGSWIVARLIPILSDKCYAGTKDCKYLDYIAFALKNQDLMLEATDKTENQLIDYWVGLVATEFGLNKDELKGVYNRDTDPHNSELRARYLWKYAASRVVASTPSAFVNGVKLSNPPSSAQEWAQLVGETYYTRRNTVKRPTESL
eukprot:403343586